jgi:hypothetical protein
MCDKASFREPEHGHFRDKENIEMISPRSAKELHNAAIELMKEKHRDMGLLEDTVR